MNDFNFKQGPTQSLPSGHAHQQQQQLRFYHICTDGENNGIVHMDDRDYESAIRISAICAERHKVVIICYCHMSTHSHFVVWAGDYESAYAFANSFKRDHSQYMSSAHGTIGIYKDVDATPKEITDIRYLKACISYVLLNPVAAGIASRPEDYRWSSFSAYFNDTPIYGIPVSSLSVRKVRGMLHTHDDLSHSRMVINLNGTPEDRSFIDYRLVESLFKGKTEFYRSLALTKHAEQEAIYVTHPVKYTDNELHAEAVAMSTALFNEASITTLTKDQKHKLLASLHRKTKAKHTRLARVLRIPASEAANVLGIIETPK